MKTNSIKKLISYCLLLFFIVNSFGQGSVKDSRRELKQPANLDISKVPNKVSMAFRKDFPLTSNAYWYGYPAFHYLSNWYEIDSYVFIDNPPAYAVEFNDGNLSYKAIYTEEGKRIAVHKETKSGLPKAVLAAIDNRKYKEWTLGSDVDEIFKDNESDRLKVYKVQVTKGNAQRELYFKSDGQLLKDKNVSEKLLK
jgi:hypothetical protein